MLHLVTGINAVNSLFLRILCFFRLFLLYITVSARKNSDSITPMCCRLVVQASKIL